MTRDVIATIGAAFLSAVMTAGCAGTESPAPAPAAVETPVAAPDVTVAPLTELAAQFDALDGQQRETGRHIAELLAQYQKRGGTLPPGFGADLTDEQRTLLAERIKTERASQRVLLQDIIERDKALADLRARSTAMTGQLPERVDVKEGDRHDRIAMDFLIRKGVPAAKAYELVSQINLQDALVPGFRVWNHYQNGQFGTWVTGGTSGVTPQQHQQRLTEMLQSERDSAIGELDRARADLSDTRNIARAAEQALEASAADLRAMTAAAEQQQAENEARAAAASTIQYVVGPKNALVKQGIIDGRMRLRAVGSPNAQPLDLRGGSDIAVDGSAHNMKRIKRVTLVPEVFMPGIDYAVVIEGPFARVQVLQRDKFAVNRFMAVVLE